MKLLWILLCSLLPLSTLTACRATRAPHAADAEEEEPVRAVAVSPDGTPTPVASTPELRTARLRPLLVEDALYTIPDVAWQMQRVGDLNGDGLEDLVVQRGGVFWARVRFARWTSVTGWGHPKTPARIDAVSARDGSLIRTLWSSEEVTAINWDAGGDLDGDSVPDLLVGHDGSAVAVSGSTTGQPRRL